MVKAGLVLLDLIIIQYNPPLCDKGHLYLPASFCRLSQYRLSHLMQNSPSSPGSQRWGLGGELSWFSAVLSPPLDPHPQELCAMGPCTSPRGISAWLSAWERKVTREKGMSKSLFSDTLCHCQERFRWFAKIYTGNATI